MKREIAVLPARRSETQRTKQLELQWKSARIRCNDVELSCRREKQESLCKLTPVPPPPPAAAAAAATAIHSPYPLLNYLMGTYV
ncbi:hypothetical protein RB195_007379 [Necator americanus]|uniref:Uncharacterized protein n=1 Tax=Necator americanus TaxID=51031 RepID=A0ABR1BZY2_NECAM